MCVTYISGFLFVYIYLYKLNKNVVPCLLHKLAVSIYGEMLSVSFQMLMYSAFLSSCDDPVNFNNVLEKQTFGIELCKSYLLMLNIILAS